MKKNILPTLLSVLTILLGTAPLQAQVDCDAYYPMRSGSVLEMTNYNAKGKATGISRTEIVEKERSGSALIFQANATIMDEKRKELNKSSYDMICDGGEFKMDMRSMAAGQPAIEGAEMEIESDQLVFPNVLRTGMDLPEGSITIKVKMNGMQIMNNTIRVYNRKVTGMESKTTPAGTFDCVVLEEDVDFGMGGMHFSAHSKSWLSKGAGMVRTESTKNGKLESYSELTMLQR
jgi:hypothetical protein